MYKCKQTTNKVESIQNQSNVTYILSEIQRIHIINKETIRIIFNFSISENLMSNVSSHRNDLALLKLDKSPIMNGSVGVACLPEAGEIPTHGTPCYISGWGNLYSNVTVSSSVIPPLH